METVASNPVASRSHLPTVPRIAEYAGGGIVPGCSPGTTRSQHVVAGGRSLVPELDRAKSDQGHCCELCCVEAPPRRHARQAPAGSGGGINSISAGGGMGWFARGEGVTGL